MKASLNILISNAAMLDQDSFCQVNFEFDEIKASSKFSPG
jgi:hypothetical protein